jgi:outer membrane biosynthesis protein TonB
MKCRRLLTILSAAILALVLASAAPAQDSAAADASHPAIVITKLSPTVYPPIARTAHITGDVTVTLGILNDGAIEAAAATSGPPLLHTAATAERVTIPVRAQKLQRCH